MAQMKSAMLVVVFALLAFPTLGQGGGQSEVSINFSGNFQAQTEGLGVTDTASYSGGILVNYRYHFNRWSAIEVNYDHSRFTQRYTPAVTATQANANEFTMAYVNTFGRPANASFEPFIEAGTGALIFSPIQAGSTVGALKQNRAVFLFGGGLEWRPIRHISLRLGYRGLIYQAPDFLIAGQQTTNAVTTMSEPYAGVAIRF
jgi:opacity protein-like surface antigen